MNSPVQHRQRWLRIAKEKLNLLQCLERFMRRSQEMRAAQSEGDDRAGESLGEIFELYGELEREVARHFPPEAELVSEEEAVRDFAAGVMLLTHYEETVLSDLPIVDTVGSRTLTGFQVDFENSAVNRRRVRSALEHAFDLGPRGLAELQLSLKPELDALSLRHTIVLGIDQIHPMRTGDPALLETVHTLFSRLYQAGVFRPGEVDLIRTGTSLFFSIPFPGTSEFDAALASRSPEEQKALRAYMRQFGEVRQVDYVNFPVFGFFRGEGADRTLLAELVKVTGVSQEKVANVLSTMVSILPRHEVDKYIVHDAWGHQWQAALLGFEEAYQQVATYERLPDLDHEVVDREGIRVRFDAALDQMVTPLSRGEEPPTEAWDRFLEAELSRRLVVSKNGLIAEMLADIVEYKYLSLHSEYRERLISSSFFKEMPTKIDLTISDVSYFFGLALKGFERLIAEPGRREALIAEYREHRSGADVKHIRGAVDRLTQRTAEWLNWLFAPELRYEETDEGIYMNRCGRILFNLLGLNAVLNSKIRALKEQRIPRDLPVRSFEDLLVLSLATFYEHDRERNFWRLDEYVFYHFEACFRRFMEALGEVGDS